MLGIRGPAYLCPSADVAPHPKRGENPRSGPIARRATTLTTTLTATLRAAPLTIPLLALLALLTLLAPPSAHAGPDPSASSPYEVTQDYAASHATGMGSPAAKGGFSIDPQTGAVGMSLPLFSLPDVEGISDLSLAFVQAQAYDFSPLTDRWGFGSGWTVDLPFVVLPGTDGAPEGLQQKTIFTASGKTYTPDQSCQPSEGIAQGTYPGSQTCSGLYQYKVRDLAFFDLTNDTTLPPLPPTWIYNPSQAPSATKKGQQPTYAYRIEMLNGVQQYFSKDGDLLLHQDRHGRQAIFTWNDSHALQAIYTGKSLPGGTAIGQTISFDYEDSGDTVTITLPDRATASKVQGQSLVSGSTAGGTVTLTGQGSQLQKISRSTGQGDPVDTEIYYTPQTHSTPSGPYTVQMPCAISYPTGSQAQIAYQNIPRYSGSSTPTDGPLAGLWTAHTTVAPDKDPCDVDNPALSPYTVLNFHPDDTGRDWTGGASQGQGQGPGGTYQGPKDLAEKGGGDGQDPGNYYTYKTQVSQTLKRPTGPEDVDRSPGDTVETHTFSYLALPESAVTEVAVDSSGTLEPLSSQKTTYQGQDGDGGWPDPFQDLDPNYASPRQIDQDQHCQEVGSIDCPSGSGPAQTTVTSKYNPQGQKIYERQSLDEEGSQDAIVLKTGYDEDTSPYGVSLMSCHAAIEGSAPDPTDPSSCPKDAASSIQANLTLTEKGTEVATSQSQGTDSSGKTTEDSLVSFTYSQDDPALLEQQVSQSSSGKCTLAMPPATPTCPATTTTYETKEDPTGGVLTKTATQTIENDGETEQISSAQTISELLGGRSVGASHQEGQDGPVTISYETLDDIGQTLSATLPTGATTTQTHTIGTWSLKASEQGFDGPYRGESHTGQITTTTTTSEDPASGKTQTYETELATDELGRPAYSADSIPASGLDPQTQTSASGLRVLSQKTYDSYGRSKATYDAHVIPSMVSYDPQSRVLESEGPNPSQSDTADAFDEPITATTTYDDVGRQIQTKAQAGNLTSPTKTHTMNVAGMPTKVEVDAPEDSWNFTSTKTYDGLGRVVDETDPTDDQTEDTYNPTQTQKSQTTDFADGGSLTATPTYDENNLTTQTAITDGTETAQSTTRVFDDFGRAVSEEDQVGTVSSVTSYVGTLPAASQTVAPDGKDPFTTQKKSYDPTTALPLTSQTNVAPQGELPALSEKTDLTYDTLGRTTKIADESGEAMTYSYYPDGALERIAYPDGRTFIYSYTDRGELSYIEDSAGPDTSEGPDTIFAYNPSGKLVSKDQTNAGKSTTTYNDLGSAIGTQIADTDGKVLASTASTLNQTQLPTVTISCQGTLASTGLACQDPSDQIEKTSLTYDEKTLEVTDKVREVPASAGSDQTYSYTYDSRHRLCRSDLAEGQNTTTTFYTLDLQDNVTETYTATDSPSAGCSPPGGLEPDSKTSYDEINRAQGTNIYQDPRYPRNQTQSKDGSTAFSYDAGNDLTSVTHAPQGAQESQGGQESQAPQGASQTITLEEWPDGSSKSISDGKTTITRYWSNGGIAAERDDSGNTVSYVGSLDLTVRDLSGASSATTVLTHDHLGSVTAEFAPTGSATIRSYSDYGVETDYTGQTGSAGSSAKAKAEAEGEAQGSAEGEGAGVGEGAGAQTKTGPAGGVGGADAKAKTKTGTTDGTPGAGGQSTAPPAKTPKAPTASAGAAVGQAVADGSALSIASNPIGYANALQVASTGVYQMGARAYLPQEGRFLTYDLCQATQNRYSYTGGDPINRVDPTGCSWLSANFEKVLGIVGDAVGLAGMASPLGFALEAMSIALTIDGFHKFMSAKAAEDLSIATMVLGGVDILGGGAAALVDRLQAARGTARAARTVGAPAEETAPLLPLRAGPSGRADDVPEQLRPLTQLLSPTPGATGALSPASRNSCLFCALAVHDVLSGRQYVPQAPYAVGETDLLTRSSQLEMQQLPFSRAVKFAPRPDEGATVAGVVRRITEDLVTTDSGKDRLILTWARKSTRTGHAVAVVAVNGSPWIIDLQDVRRQIHQDFERLVNAATAAGVHPQHDLEWRWYLPNASEPLHFPGQDWNPPHWPRRLPPGPVPLVQ